MTITKHPRLEPVGVYRNEEGRPTCGLFHDTDKQTLEFYRWEKMSMEEVLDLNNNGHAHDVANGRKTLPTTSEIIKQVIEEDK